MANILYDDFKIQFATNKIHMCLKPPITYISNSQIFQPLDPFTLLKEVSGCAKSWRASECWDRHGVQQQ